MKNTYVDILIASLMKKIQILDEITVLNDEQDILLDDPNVTPEDIEGNIAQKSDRIDQLERLDDGFEQTFTRVKDLFQENRSDYKDEIERMKTLIREITEKSNHIKVQESRNHLKMTNKFTSVRTQVREIRNSQRAVKEYYRAMGRQEQKDSYFIDDKK